MPLSDISRPRTRTVVAAGAAAATAAVVMVPAAPTMATEESDDSHCVIQIEGVEETGEFITAEPVCFGTLAEALASAGVDIDPQARINMSDVVADDLLATAAASSGPLGIHFDGFNVTGSSITVTGSDCGGGYINLSNAWVNRISSTYNLCPVVRFWDGYDKSGGFESTSPSQINLVPLNNAANSVQYASA